MLLRYQSFYTGYINYLEKYAQILTLGDGFVKIF